jgi:predicted MPP superfamily phosphohydrolase
MKKSKLKIPVIIASVFGLSLFAFYNKLEVNRYKLKTDKFNEGNKIKIVLISDLHSYVYKNEQSEIADLIKAQKPDLIALTGDIADDIIPIRGTKLFLEKIKSIAPIYYVSGNHEFRTRKINDIKAMFRKNNVKVLEHSFEEIEIRGEKIIIAGVDDPAISIYEKPYFDWEKQMYYNFKELEQKQVYKILLAHRPEPIEAYKKMLFDLVLSGHAHGGLIRIPFILKNGLFSTNQGFFPKYTGGIYVHNKLNHIISRGVSHKFYQPRIFNRPHVVSIEIVGQK